LQATPGGGADALYGEDGNDTLFGGDSFHTDILVGGAGNDSLNGYSGQARSWSPGRSRSLPMA
jgi:Ca2+-binding RTX toxin-like protein